jgi:hypothetical protein
MTFERYAERIPNITALLKANGIANIEECEKICQNNGVDCHNTVRMIQPIAFEDACWAYCVGAAIALSHKSESMTEICRWLGEGLQSFAIAESVADIRRIGIGHGLFALKLLHPLTRNFAFVAGHESFAAAEGAVGIISHANNFRAEPITVSLVGLGKPAARIISRYKGFTYILTEYSHYSNSIAIIDKLKYGNYNVSCYGAHSVDEGVEILRYANIDTIITGNSTSHIKFTDPTVATYKKLKYSENQHVFCVASGGGTGRTMHPDNVGAGAASWGMTDTTGRMHSDLQFAGSSSVPAHVEMVGFIGMGNNPIVGATVSIACIIANRLSIKSFDGENR